MLLRRFGAIDGPDNFDLIFRFINVGTPTNKSKRGLRVSSMDVVKDTIESYKSLCAKADETPHGFITTIPDKLMVLIDRIEEQDEQILELCRQLSDLSDDYIRRHNEAVDRWLENHQLQRENERLRAQLAMAGTVAPPVVP